MAGNRLSGKNPLIKGRGSSGNGPEWNRTSPRLAREPRLVLRSPPPPPPLLMPLRSGKWERESVRGEDYVIRGGDSPSVSV